MPLKFSQNQYQLGSVPKQTPKSFQISVQNTGESVLQVKRIGVGCGACTSASLKDMTIQPMQSTTMSVTFKGNSSGQNMPKSVTITYDESGVQKSEVFTFIVTVPN